jgi:uracil-DNA glycosylase
MTVEIAKKAYVVDAVRTSELRKNRDLLRREIDLLQPDFVVLVGGEAERIMGSAARQAEPDRYSRVNFPNNGRDKARTTKDGKLFEKLGRRLQELHP